jgi:colanic acid biosynthesis glycosyl transferase WcaI
LNICILSYFFSPIYTGNGTRYPLILAESLAKRGHKVKVVTVFPQNLDGKFSARYRDKFFTREHANGIEVFRVLVPSFQHFGFIKRLILYISFMFSSILGVIFVGKTDVILGTSPEPPFLIVPGLIYSRFKKAPYVLTLGDLWPDTLFDLELLKSSLLKKTVTFVSLLSYKIANHIFVITSSIKKGIVNYGIAAEKITVVELGVDTNFFQPHKKNMKLENGLFINKFIVMYSGIFGPTYDFDTLLEAAKLLEPFRDIMFVIRGHGECEKSIRNKILELSLSNVQLLGPVSDAKKVIEYLNLADLFLVPMKNIKVAETAHPSKVFEFLACQKPVICCAKGELAKLVDNSRCGFAVEPENPKILAEAIIELYRNNKERIAMGERGRDYVAHNFSYEYVGRKIEDIFERELIDK